MAALKELIKSVDALIDEMKLVVPDLNGIYERSDAMLANYPGNGTRFANHIDNTTNDGRRITVLLYLNPGNYIF
jgi:hypoxia-inducible factor (prolyl hydroxylase)